MKGRPLYSKFCCLLGNRTATWLAILVVMATVFTMLNVYIVYSFQSQNGIENVPQRNGMETQRRSTPSVWIYHDTVCVVEAMNIIIQ